MPRLTQSLPRMRKHKASGQAVVNLDGHRVYLGKWGSRIAKEQFDRVVAEWLAQNRSLPKVAEPEFVSINDVLLRYIKHAKVYYRKDGKELPEVDHVKRIAKTVSAMYGKLPASTFGPIALKAVREHLIKEGLARVTINQHVRRIVRIFKHAAENEMIDGALVVNLQQVPGLRKGKTNAKETAPITPVDDVVVDATLPHMTPVIADMVRMQRLTGARPGELCILRPCDVDRSAEVWQYRPSSHKTERLGKERVIAIGPKAQAVLLPYLLRDSNAYCFSPAESEAKRNAAKERKTPLKYGNRKGYSKRTREGKRRKRPPKECYTTNTYRTAIHRACDKAGVDRWSPNRLRHARATEIRRDYGLEEASHVLGHSSVNITEVYAKRNAEVAMRVARETG